MKTQGTCFCGEEDEREQDCVLLKTEHTLQKLHREGLYLIKEIESSD